MGSKKVTLFWGNLPLARLVAPLGPQVGFLLKKCNKMQRLTRIVAHIKTPD